MDRIRKSIDDGRERTDASLGAERATSAAMRTRTRRDFSDLIEHDRLIVDQQLFKFRDRADRLLATERLAAPSPDASVAQERHAADEAMRDERENTDAILDRARQRSDDAVTSRDRPNVESESATTLERQMETDENISTERHGIDDAVSVFGETKEALSRAVIERHQDVLAMVTHELRNPLVAISMSAQFLADRAIDAETREAAVDVQRSAARMTRLLSDLLDGARIDARTFLVVPARHDVGALLREIRALDTPVVFHFSIAPDSRGASLVEREHATQPFASADAAEGRGRIPGGEGDDVAQPLVVALGVVVLHELVHDGAQMTFAEGNDVPEALGLDRPNKPFGIGVQIRAPRRQAQQLNAGGLQESPEVRRKEGIAIDDEVPEARQRARRGVGEVAGDLRHPSPVGRTGDAGDVNASGLEVDDEQHEVAYEPSAREHLHAEEVGCGDGTPVRPEKRLPRHRPSPERSGLDAVLGEDALDGGPSEFEAEVLECTAKPRVAPRRILARHREQLLDFVTSGGWTARTDADTTPVVLRSDLLAVPPKDGLRRCERRHISQQLASERLSLLGEQPSLGIGEAKTFGPEPGTQHAVLGAQVLDRVALPATDPAGDQQDEELKRSGGCHGRRTIAHPDRGGRTAESRARSTSGTLRGELPLGDSNANTPATSTRTLGGTPDHVLDRSRAPTWRLDQPCRRGSGSTRR